MLSQRYGPFLMLILATISLNDVHGQCTINKTRSEPKFPDPKELYKLGVEYALKVEVNDIQKMRSMYAAEYFTTVDSKGRVDSHFNGTQKSFLYNTETKEGFIFGRPPDCQTNITDSIKPPYEDFNVYDWKYQDGPVLKFGPLSMLLKGFEKREEMEFEEFKMVRGLVANSWKRCAEENKVTIRYMMIDETQSKEIYGFQNLPVPLRITVEGPSINQSYEFVHFQVGIEDSSTVFSIPFNKGCERLIEPEKKMEYRAYNFAFEAEIVYTVTLQKDKHIYINNLKAVYDNTSELFAYTTIPWIAHNDSNFANAGDELFRVYDVNNGYLYEVDLDANSCNISAKTPEESGADLFLPTGDKVSLLNPDIITLNNETAAGYKYLGMGTERGKKVDVFEKTWGGVLSKYISTRYYLADGQKEISNTEEKNPLLKVVYTEYFAGMPTTELVFNFYHYNTLLTHKPKHFDVSSCFKEQNQTEWFQVSYPLAGVGLTAQELQDALPKIQDNFFKVLMMDNIVTPVRVPKTVVGLSADFLYIVAALLERVPAKLDFQFQANVRLKPEMYFVRQGITTEEGCYQACIQNKKCRAINYCGLNCGLISIEYTPEMGTADKKCTLYQKVKNSTQLTMKQVNQKIAERIGTGDFKLIFSDGKGHLQTLTSPEFKQGIAFGLNDPNDGIKIDSSFSIFKQGADIKTPDSASVRTFAECQRECLRDTACESIAFCGITSSCSFSKFHGDEIGEKNLAQDDKCIILNKKYLYLFKEYPGVSMIRTAEAKFDYNSPESCAKACRQSASMSTECRSFDLCFDAGKSNCLLHSTHVVGSNDDDVQASTCTHYSRNYVLDFTVQKEMAITEGAAQEKIYNLQVVEECAKYCVENPNCKTFDFCRKPFEMTSQCYISTIAPTQNQLRDDQYCSFYSKSDMKTAKLLADDDGKKKEVKVVEVVEDTGYSKSLTGGISFFIFLVGIAIGAAAMFGYGYYKANRRV